MRYPDGGELTAEGRSRRERLRLQAAAQMFAQDKDQLWTLARVAELIQQLFDVLYTLRGVSYLLHRNGFTPRSPRTAPSSAMRTPSPSGRR